MPALHATNCAPVPVEQRSLHAQCARFVLGGRHWIEAQHIDGGIESRPTRYDLHVSILQELFVVHLLFSLSVSPLRTLQVQASSPLVSTLCDNARQLLRSPRLQWTFAPCSNFLTGFCLKMRMPQRASTCWQDIQTALGWACYELAAFGSSLSVQRPLSLELMRLDGSLAKRLTPDSFTASILAAQRSALTVTKTCPKTSCTGLGARSRALIAPFCLAQLRVPLQRLWSVHWCPELDGHVLRPTEAWVDIPMVAAAPPVRQDGPLPASALAYLEHPCLLCGTAENSVHWLQSCPVLCLAARLLGAPGVLQLTDGLQNCCHVH